jgi:hypothetical protein
MSMPSRLPVSLARLVLAVAAVVAVNWSAAAQNFQQLGCIPHVADKKWWFAGVGLTPKATDPNFYSDTDGYAFNVKAGGNTFLIPGEDSAISVLKTFRSQGDERFKLLKYSLVIDNSASIEPSDQADITNFLTNFIEKLPLAVEGQIIRFSATVEKGPFSVVKRELQMQLAKPVQSASTALHDALMRGATSLAREGSDAPVKVLIMFTDGFENSSTDYKDRDSFIASFTNLVKTENIAVLALGVGKDQDEPLLRTITDRSRGVAGYYIRIESFGKSFRRHGPVQDDPGKRRHLPPQEGRPRQGTSPDCPGGKIKDHRQGHEHFSHV